MPYARLGFLLLVLTLGCDAADPPLEDTDGTLAFTLNGTPWTHTTEPVATLTPYGFSLHAEWHSEALYPYRQSFSVSLTHVEWNGVGVYPIARRTVDGEPYLAFLNESDGDATIANYYPVEGAAGRFEVTRFDAGTGAFEGRFAGTFAVDPNQRNQPLRALPDTLRVTDGRFRAVLEDRR